MIYTNKKVFFIQKYASLQKYVKITGYDFKTIYVNQVSIIVNSRNIFCLGWKSDKSLATQNKKDDLSDNLDNIRDNLKQLFFIQQYASLQKYVKITGYDFKTIYVNQVSIIVNSRNIFCLGWKSDKSLATQNKNDDLSDNDDNVRDNDNNFIVQKNIKRDIVNNNEL